MINTSINYWKTQIMLRRKWLLNKLPVGRSSNFTRFIILCDPRTGSTWLHTLLNSSPKIMSYGEILTEKDMSLGLEQTIWKPHHHSIKAVGCKIFYEQLITPAFEHIFKEIKNSPHIKIIDLTRENKIETFVSLKIAEQTDAWSVGAKHAKSRQSVYINEEELEEYMARQERNKTYILDEVKKRDLYSVVYEKLSHKTDIILAEVQSFLGVKPRRLFSLLKKQNPEPLQELVLNYEEIESRIN